MIIYHSKIQYHGKFSMAMEEYFSPAKKRMISVSYLSGRKVSQEKTVANGGKMNWKTININPKNIVSGTIGKTKTLARGEMSERFLKLKRIVGKTKTCAESVKIKISHIPKARCFLSIWFSKKGEK